jgi:hypothetical protein
MENVKGIIYKVINNETNEQYIGATTKSIEKRKEDHCQKSNSGSNINFHEAISTYGPDTFHWVQIDTANNYNELAKKEIKYIEENNTIEEGYNSDKGGGFKKSIYKYDLSGTLNFTYNNLTEAGESINARKQDISRACWSINNALGGFLWSYDYAEPFIPKNDNRRKEVFQYSLKGNLLARYVSASEASRKTGVSKTCITRCCREEREHSGGFLWKFI